MNAAGNPVSTDYLDGIYETFE